MNKTRVIMANIREHRRGQILRQFYVWYRWTTLCRESIFVSFYLFFFACLWLAYVCLGYCVPFVYTATERSDPSAALVQTVNNTQARWRMALHWKGYNFWPFWWHFSKAKPNTCCENTQTRVEENVKTCETGVIATFEAYTVQTTNAAIVELAPDRGRNQSGTTFKSI